MSDMERVVVLPLLAADLIPLVLKHPSMFSEEEISRLIDVYYLGKDRPPWRWFDDEDEAVVLKCHRELIPREDSSYDDQEEQTSGTNGAADGGQASLGWTT